MICKMVALSMPQVFVSFTRLPHVNINRVKAGRTVTFWNGRRSNIVQIDVMIIMINEVITCKSNKHSPPHPE